MLLTSFSKSPIETSPVPEVGGDTLKFLIQLDVIGLSTEDIKYGKMTSREEFSNNYILRATPTVLILLIHIDNQSTFSPIIVVLIEILI